MKKLVANILSVFIMTALLLTVSPAQADAASRKKIHRAVKVVKHQKGDPYRYGASGPRAFDCSGLVYYAYRKAGVRRIKRTSDAQARQARRIKRRHMRRGDLMFFHYRGNVYHVGVFVGWKNGRRHFIHSPRPGSRVKRAVPWTNSWYPGTLRRR